MGEHLLCTEGVRSSSLLISTISLFLSTSGCRLLSGRCQTTAGDGCAWNINNRGEAEQVGCGVMWVTGGVRRGETRSCAGEPVMQGVGWMPWSLVPMKDVA